MSEFIFADLIAENATATLATLVTVTVVSVVAVGTCVLPCRRRELAAQIVTVTYMSGIRVAREQIPVREPQWDGSNVIDGPGSTRPGVYLVAPRNGIKTIRVRVQVTRSRNVAAIGTLTGILGGLSFVAQCPTSVGFHDVVAQMQGVPNGIECYQGDAAWTLAAPDITVALNATRLEIYFVLAVPDACHADDDQNACYRENGVWAEALRFLCRTVRVTGLDTAPRAVARITQYCHSERGLRYDSSSRYMQDDRVKEVHMLRLQDYIAGVMPSANCSDQAGAVTVLSRAIGAPVTMLELRPFGYIMPTNLMERRGCNNPTPNPKHPDFVDIRTVQEWWNVRWGFELHIFCELDGAIYDACTGPHLGTETAAGYVEAAVDSMAHIVAQHQRSRPARKSGTATYKSKQEKQREKEMEEKARWERIGSMRVDEIDLSVATAPTRAGTASDIVPFIIIDKLI